jgi:hypothetical protein
MGSRFADARGAERMRQSFGRAIAAGVSPGDLNVLHAVHVETTGRSKVTNQITLATIAFALHRLEPVESEDDLEPRELHRRASVKERIGKSLARLADVGAIEYEPGRGGRLSRITLPAVDDADPTNTTRRRGVDTDPKTTRADGVGAPSTPRGQSVNTTRRRASTPRDGVRQHHARKSPTPRGDGGTTDETDGPDRDRSGLIGESAHARDGNGTRPAAGKPGAVDAANTNRLTNRLSAAVTGDRPRTQLAIRPVIELLADHLEPKLIDQLVSDATNDGPLDHPGELLAHVWFALDGTPALDAITADPRWAITDHPEGADIALATAHTTRERWPHHLDEAITVADHWNTHDVPHAIRDEAIDTAITEGVTRPAHLDRIAQRIRRDLDGQPHPKLPTQPRRSAAERAEGGDR